MGFQEEVKMYSAVKGPEPLQICPISPDTTDMSPEDSKKVTGMVTIIKGTDTHTFVPSEKLKDVKENYFRVLVGKHPWEHWKFAIDRDPSFIMHSPFVNKDPDFIDIAVKIWDSGRGTTKVSNFIVETLGDDAEEYVETGAMRLAPECERTWRGAFPLAIKLNILKKVKRFYLSDLTLLESKYKRFVLSAKPENRKELLIAFIKRVREVSGGDYPLLLRPFIREVRCNISAPVFTDKDDIEQFEYFFGTEEKGDSKIYSYDYLVADILNLCGDEFIPELLGKYSAEGKISFDMVPEKFISSEMRKKYDIPEPMTNEQILKRVEKIILEFPEKN